MMESTRQIEETLVSLNQQGLEEFDRPPADMFAFQAGFRAYHRCGIGLGLLRRPERGDEPR